jgi:predicted O-methyltransferase YrrM
VRPTILYRAAASALPKGGETGVEFERIQQAVEGVPIMTAAQGRIIYDHVLETKPTDVLELGTASGVSAAYMAAALDELGRGTITTLDRAQFVVSPPPEQRAFAKVPELLRYVTFERPPDSSYDWWLLRQIEQRSDEAGNCTPAFDFCYLDGAHDFTIDGLAVYLVEKLLRPEAWLLLDDLNWSYAADTGHDTERFSADEIHAPHVRLIFDVLIKQHPSFTELRVQDGSWGWAKKAPGQSRRYTLETSQSLAGLVVDRLKRAALTARARRRN